MITIVKDHKTNERTDCPFCGMRLDGAIGKREPKAGDPCICPECLEVSVFSEDLTLHRPNFKQHQLLQNNVEFQAALRKIKDYMKEMKKSSK